MGKSKKFIKVKKKFINLLTNQKDGAMIVRRGTGSVLLRVNKVVGIDL